MGHRWGIDGGSKGYRWGIDGGSMGDRRGIDGASMGDHNISESVSESETESEYISGSENISETESGNLEENKSTTIVGQNDQPQKVKNKGKDNSNGDTKKKYPRLRKYR